MPPSRHRTEGQPPPPSQRWLPIRNDHDTPIPPGGVCLMTGVTDDGIITVTQPTADSQGLVVFNSRGAIAPDGVGVGTRTFPLAAAYDYASDGDAPAHGETWGVQADSWALGMGRPGYVVLGDGVGGLCNIIEDGTGGGTVAGATGRWVRITDSSGDGTYSAEEVEFDHLLGWVLVEDGLVWDYEGEGGPALVEVSLTTTVAITTVHLARPAAGENGGGLWIFKCPLEANTFGLSEDDTLVLDGPTINVTSPTVIAAPSGSDGGIIWNITQSNQPTYVNLTATTYNDLDLRSYGPGPLYIVSLVGDTTITGIVPPADGAAFTILNASPDYAITLSHDSGSSSAANRIYAPDATAASVPSLAGMTFQHNPTAGGTGRIAIAGQSGAGGSSSSGTPAWVKVTKSYTDLAVAATSNDIEIYSLPAKGVLHKVVMKHSTVFAGGGIMTYTVTVGITGTLDKYTSGGLAVSTAVSDTNDFQNGNEDGWIESYASATSIRLSAVTLGDNLNAATSGVLDIWLSVSTLP